jgi:hypothetical protein
MTEAQHFQAISILKKLGLSYLRLEPAPHGRYRYIAWNPLNPNNNGSPVVSKRGTVKATLS